MSKSLASYRDKARDKLNRSSADRTTHFFQGMDLFLDERYLLVGQSKSIVNKSKAPLVNLLFRQIFHIFTGVDIEGGAEIAIPTRRKMCDSTRSRLLRRTCNGQGRRSVHFYSSDESYKWYLGRMDPVEHRWTVDIRRLEKYLLQHRHSKRSDCWNGQTRFDSSFCKTEVTNRLMSIEGRTSKLLYRLLEWIDHRVGKDHRRHHSSLHQEIDQRWWSKGALDIAVWCTMLLTNRSHQRQRHLLSPCCLDEASYREYNN